MGNIFQYFGNLLNNKKPRFFLTFSIILFSISLIAKLIELIIYLRIKGNQNAEIINHTTSNTIQYVFSILALVFLFYGIALKLTKQLKSLNNKNVVYSSIGADYSLNLPIDQEERGTLLEKYYIQVLKQSEISFTLSVVFSIFGFIIIILPIIKFYILSPTSTQTGGEVEYIPIIAGVIIEIVSTLMLTQTNEARKTMINFSDKIREDNKLKESLKMIDTIKDENIQNKVKAIVVLKFAEIFLKDEGLQKIIQD
jgi:hypothetical protein